jgi:hypothetical protein
MEIEWGRLRRTINDLADMCGRVDPLNAAVYRREAEEFCELLAPASDAELDCLRVDAELLRRRWVERMTEPKLPVPP